MVCINIAIESPLAVNFLGTAMESCIGIYLVSSSGSLEESSFSCLLYGLALGS